MNFFKIFIIVFGSLLMGAMIFFIDDSSVIDATAATYFILINAFLGVDIAAMLNNSASMPPGEYKNMKFYRYILSFVFMIILFVMVVYRKEVNGINSIVAMSSFSSGAMIILALLLSGLEGNKIASRKAPR